MDVGPQLPLARNATVVSNCSHTHLSPQKLKANAKQCCHCMMRKLCTALAPIHSVPCTHPQIVGKSRHAKTQVALLLITVLVAVAFVPCHLVVCHVSSLPLCAQKVMVDSNLSHTFHSPRWLQPLKGTLKHHVVQVQHQTPLAALHLQSYHLQVMGPSHHVPVPITLQLAAFLQHQPTVCHSMHVHAPHLVMVAVSHVYSPSRHLTFQG